MTYRLLLWFDMLEEDGKSTIIRGLFSRVPPLSKDLSNGNNIGSGMSNIGYGYGYGISRYGGGGGDREGNGGGAGWTKITVVKI